MIAAAIPKADEWVNGCHAKRISGLSWYMLHKNVMLGKVRALAEPGCLIRYHKGDCEAIGRDLVATGGKKRSDASASKKKTRTACNGGVSVAPCVQHEADNRRILSRTQSSDVATTV
jgi:hypothetical protein